MDDTVSSISASEMTQAEQQVSDAVPDEVQNQLDSLTKEQRQGLFFGGAVLLVLFLINLIT
jgi:hypothetical protein